MSDVEASDESQSAGARPGRSDARSLVREVGVVFLASVALTGGLALLQSTVAAVAPYVYLAVAAVFVLLPTLVVRHWRREDPVEAGMVFGRIGRGVAIGALAGLMTAIPFVFGYHVWQTHFLDGAAAPSLDAYYRFPAEARGMPGALRAVADAPDGDAPAPDGIFVWTEGREIRVWWHGQEPLDVSVDTKGGTIERFSTAAPRVVDDGSRVAVWSKSTGFGGLDVLVEPGRTPVEVSVRRGASSVGPDEIRVGAGEQTPETSPLVLERSLLWIFDLLLLQFFFVALPEEYFYRGYVQPTLGRRLTEGRVGIGWLSVSHPVWIASILFALGHVLIDGNWIRLSVFFPSLVFGELRSRTGGIVAPLTYHGLCNIMVELASVHYVSA